MDDKLKYITVLPNANIFLQQELGVAHTSYLVECAFYSLIQQGDTDAAVNMLHELLNNKLIVGRMSDNSLRQMQYWAICCITLGTRYAIQGGLDEMAAFNLSDEFILKIDSVINEEGVLVVLEDAVRKITSCVKNSGLSKCSSPIRKCINYIQLHLHEKISVQDLSATAGLSKNYLSKLFKSETGYSPHEYVILKKLEAARSLINGGADEAEISYSLGFCSQSHFIQGFKKRYGITPHRFKYNKHSLNKTRVDIDKIDK